MAREYVVIEELKDKLSGSVVEIGSERGAGSTKFLSGFCDNNGLKFYTVDIEENAYNKAKSICNNAYQMTGQEFLDKVFPQDEKICFAYLDNFDYIFERIKNRDWIKEQIRLYKKLGYEMNNYVSKMHHLFQSIKIVELAAKNCFILFDDTWELKHPLTEDLCYDGKGGFAIAYLISKGFSIVKRSINQAPQNSYVLTGRCL